MCVLSTLLLAPSPHNKLQPPMHHVGQCPKPSPIAGCGVLLDEPAHAALVFRHVLAAAPPRAIPGNIRASRFETIGSPGDVNVEDSNASHVLDCW